MVFTGAGEEVLKGIREKLAKQMKKEETKASLVQIMFLIFNLSETKVLKMS